MIAASDLSRRVSALLGGEVRTSESDGRIALLTPVDRPDGEGVVVYIEEVGDGFIVSDLGTTDASLIGYVNEKVLAESAAEIASRYDVDYAGGTIRTSATIDALPEACWRVAQAAAMIGAADVYVSPARPATSSRFDDVVDKALPPDVERRARLSGFSGHEHRVSFFVPKTETVIEPIGGGRQAWQTARLVYAEFGDLSRVNGYEFTAVLDDRAGSNQLTDEARLLLQVGRVARWSEHEAWLPRLLG